MDDRTRFTTEQVLRGIQAYVYEHVDDKLVLDPYASVNEYREAVEESHECPLAFLSMLAEYFGFQFSERRWIVWLRLPNGKGLSKAQRGRLWEAWQKRTAHELTVRKLAEHIADLAPGTSMEPATVFGVPCAPAGVFHGLCKLPEVVGKRVGPSTQIGKVLGGWKIEQLYGRAEWISDTSLPPLKRNPWWSLSSPSNWVDGIGLGTAILAALGALIYVGVVTESAFWGFVVAVPTLAVILLIVSACSDAIRNPLPDGITTFGDLARLIADQERDAIRG